MPSLGLQTSAASQQVVGCLTWIQTPHTRELACQFLRSVKTAQFSHARNLQLLKPLLCSDVAFYQRSWASAHVPLLVLPRLAADASHPATAPKPVLTCAPLQGDVRDSEEQWSDLPALPTGHFQNRNTTMKPF